MKTDASRPVTPAISKTAERVRGYAGDWIAGGLYALAIASGMVSQVAAALAGTIPHDNYFYYLWMLAISVLITIPLMLSLRVGAIVAVVFHTVLLLMAIYGMWVMRTVTAGYVLNLAMICYCAARLRGSLGPPLILARREAV
jgi:hypothetical protein